MMNNPTQTLLLALIVVFAVCFLPLFPCSCLPQASLTVPTYSPCSLPSRSTTPTHFYTISPIHILPSPHTPIQKHFPTQFFATISTAAPRANLIDDISADIPIPFVRINYTMVFPDGYTVHQWETVFNKLDKACGLNSRNMIKNGSTSSFISYTPLANTTFADFRTKCDAAFKKNQEELNVYGQVKKTEYALTMMEAKCATTCGIEECPACPLLSKCTADEQCGEGAVCKESQQYPNKKWCVSGASGLTTMMALVIAVFAAVAMF